MDLKISYKRKQKNSPKLPNMTMGMTKEQLSFKMRQII